MGNNYDDGQFRSTRKRGRDASSMLRWVAVAVVAAIVGAGSTLAAIPLMLQYNLLPSPAVSAANLQPTSFSAPGAKTVNETVNVTVNDAIVQAVKRVTPSVVGVVNWQYEPNANGVGRSLQQYGVGSGVIFSPKGYIITNNHVVQGATKVEVVLGNKVHMYAQVVGADPYTDLAVLKIPSRYVKPQDVAQFGNSSTLQAGEPAIAIGNPAGLDFADTVTVGVISATQRVMPVIDEQTGLPIGDETVLQTDAAINPGNSGGPLCNILGQVVGINSSKIVAKGFEGMGFSIPINEVKLIAGQILATGHAEHPAIGVEVESLSQVPQQYQPNVPVNNGVYIVHVTSAAAKAAGLQHGDVIVAVNGHAISGVSALQTELWTNFKPGDVVTVTVYRGQQKLNMKVKLGILPPPPAPSTSQQPQSGGQFVVPFGGSGGSNGNNGNNGGSSFTFP